MLHQYRNKILQIWAGHQIFFSAGSERFQFGGYEVNWGNRF